MGGIPKDYVIAKVINGSWAFWNQRKELWDPRLESAIVFSDPEDAMEYAHKHNMTRNGQCFVFMKDGDKLANNFYMTS